MDLVIWVVMLVAALVILGGGLALRLRPRHGAQIILATAYLRALRTTHDKKESQPQVALGQVVHIAEGQRSPQRLQDHDSLRAFVAGVRKEGV